MKDQERPDSSDEAVSALFQALSPGSPLAEEVEALLTSGPVEVDERALDEATERLYARLASDEATTQPQRRVARMLWIAPVAAAGLALAAAALFWMSTPPVVPDHGSLETVATHQVQQVNAVSTEALELASDSEATVAADRLLLKSGSVVFRREQGLDPAVKQVELVQVGWTLLPVGTVFAASTRGDFAAVTVRSGVVEVSSEGQVLAELGRGDWLVIGPEGTVRFEDASQPQLDEASLELVRQARWLALPQRTRDALEQR